MNTRLFTSLALACVTLSIAPGQGGLLAPSAAHAQEPSAIDQREYDDVIRKLEHDLDEQISRKNTIYDATIARHRKALKPILARMKRGGVDTTSRQAAFDAIVEDAYARLAVAQAKKLRGAIKKEVPRIAPEPGIDPIAPTAPTWCATIDAALKGPSKAREIQMPSTASSITLLSIRDALEFSCGAKDFPLTQKWTAAYRQDLSNKLGLSAAQNLELITFAARNYRKVDYSDRRELKEEPTAAACEGFGKPESALAEDQMSRALERGLLRCKGRVTSVPTSRRLPFDGQDMFWLIDLAGYPSTHTARLGLAERLLRRGLYDQDIADPIKARDPLLLVNNYALAGVLPIERAEVFAELDAAISDPEARWSARIEALAALRDLARARAFVLRQAEGNPGFKAVFLDAPARGYASFAETSKGSEDVLELVLSLEDKLMRGDSIEGCGEVVHDKLKPWLKARHKSSKFKHYEDVSFDDYEGSLILHAVMMCGASDTANVPALAQAFGELHYATADIQRGPLSAAYKAMFDAYNDYRVSPPKKSKKSFSRKRGGASDGFVQIELAGVHPTPIMPPRVPVFSAQFRYAKVDNGLAMRMMKGKQPTTFHALQGVISKVSKADGGRVEITFKRERYKSPVRECKDTGRIDRVDVVGNELRAIPEYACKTVGYETVKVDLDPILVPEWAAGQLKKGQSLVYFATKPVRHKKQPAFGWPVASFKSKKARRLVTLHGVKL
jgi:hypothetical protein